MSFAMKNLNRECWDGLARISRFSKTFGRESTRINTNLFNNKTKTVEMFFGRAFCFSFVLFAQFRLKTKY